MTKYIPWAVVSVYLAFQVFAWNILKIQFIDFHLAAVIRVITAITSLISIYYIVHSKDTHWIKGVGYALFSVANLQISRVAYDAHLPIGVSTLMFLGSSLALLYNSYIHFKETNNTDR